MDRTWEKESAANANANANANYKKEKNVGHPLSAGHAQYFLCHQLFFIFPLYWLANSLVRLFSDSKNHSSVCFL